MTKTTLPAKIQPASSPVSFYEQATQALAKNTVANRMKVHSRIERLVAGPYLELFAHASRPGWTTWGNEVPSQATE